MSGTGEHWQVIAATQARHSTTLAGLAGRLDALAVAAGRIRAVHGAQLDRILLAAALLPGRPDRG